MKMQKRIMTLAAALMTAALAWANTTTAVTQVSSAVTVADDVDYVISSATPFAAGGQVDITNTEHAVVIISKIRPSIVKSTWLTGHVYINGKQAVDGSNCQVKMYNGGTIIMPYSSGIRPLTVYSEKDFGGTSVNAFGLEHSGGYMNTLTEAKLNNNIRSFKLKRGYMVTFSTRASGRGYSRCFIADKADLEIASLPAVLDGTISSYRVFQWYDAQKKGIGDNTRASDNALINSSWCYDWATGVNLLPDVECVPNHIYEDWPSSAACGSVTYACHMKTNNEPGNSLDDHPQTVAQVLANWENLMRTGLRLGSETSHDGSWGHLEEFIDSIDARGWRCDVVDLHCYWPKDNFFNWKYYYERFGNRPIWISEWVVGASWNNNGIFATDRSYSTANQQLNAEYLQYVIPSMNNSPYIERYAYWNSEADCSKIIKDGALSIAGKYYAEMESGMAYNRAYEKIPTNPRQYNPSDLEATFDKNSQKVTLAWNDKNGEYNRSMEIQCKKVGTSVWKTVQTVEQKEEAADYSVTVDGIDGDKFRVRIVDLIGKERLTNEATAVNDNLEYGDGVTVIADGNIKTMYLGGNILINGGFDLGFTDWTNAAGQPLSAPYYQVVRKGGIDGGAYLQCYGNSTSKTDAQSIVRYMELEKNTSYYVEAAGSNMDAASQRFLTGRTTTGVNKRLEFAETSGWAKVGSSFTVGEDTILSMQLIKLGGKAMIDNIMLSRLFDTREEALADAKTCVARRFEAFKAYNTAVPQLNTMLQAYMGEAGVTAEEMETAVGNAVQALSQRTAVDSLASDVALMTKYGLAGAEEAAAMYAAVKGFTQQSIAQYLDDVQALRAIVKAAFVPTKVNDIIKNPDFSSDYGWNVKTGTYNGGDQRTNTVSGKTCWNAWWSLSAASNPTATMSIDQELTKLAGGLYALECKATTQHYCVNDQHAYLIVGGDTVVSQPLQYGLADLPNFSAAEVWNTLVTPYIYVESNSTVKIGFTGSKNGVKDKQWIKYGDATSTGDNREGWWCATDFTLRYMPVLLKETDESGWGTICSANVIDVPEGVTLYRIAGLSADSLYIGVEEVTGTPEAGVPYIYRTTPLQSLMFTYSGDAVVSPQINVNGLRGVFTSSAKYPLDALVLTNGKWVNVTERYAMTSNSGWIRYVKNVPVLPEGWTGETIPTEGLVKGTGIGHVQADGAASASRTYGLGGQIVPDDSKGIVIRNNRKELHK